MVSIRNATPAQLEAARSLIMRGKAGASRGDPILGPLVNELAAAGIQSFEGAVRQAKEREAAQKQFEEAQKKAAQEAAKKNSTINQIIENSKLTPKEQLQKAVEVAKTKSKVVSPTYNPNTKTFTDISGNKQSMSLANARRIGAVIQTTNNLNQNPYTFTVLENKYKDLIKNNKFIGTDSQFQQYQKEYNRIQNIQNDPLYFAKNNLSGRELLSYSVQTSKEQKELISQMLNSNEYKKLVNDYKNAGYSDKRAKELAQESYTSQTSIVPSVNSLKDINFKDKESLKLLHNFIVQTQKQVPIVIKDYVKSLAKGTVKVGLYAIDEAGYATQIRLNTKNKELYIPKGTKEISDRFGKAKKWSGYSFKNNPFKDPDYQNVGITTGFLLLGITSPATATKAFGAVKGKAIWNAIKDPTPSSIANVEALFIPELIGKGLSSATKKLVSSSEGRGFVVVKPKKITKTPLSSTFPKEFEIKIDKLAVDSYLRNGFSRRGINFNSLSEVQKNWARGQIESKIKINPDRFIPEIRKVALKRAGVKNLRKYTLDRLNSPLEKFKISDLLSKSERERIVSQIKAKVRANPELTLSKAQRRALKNAKRSSELDRIKQAINKKLKGETNDRKGITFKRAYEPSEPISSGKRQKLVQIQKPKLLELEKKIKFKASVRLSEQQKLALRRFKELANKEKKIFDETKSVSERIKRINKQISKEKAKLKSKGKSRTKQKQSSRSKVREDLITKLDSKFIKLSRIFQGLVLRQKQIQKSGSIQLQKLSPKVKQATRIQQKYSQKLKTSQKSKYKFAQPIASSQLQRQPQKEKSVLKLRKIQIQKDKFIVPSMRTSSKRRPKKKSSKVIAFNVYGKARGKFIKLNKKPLTKNDALARGAYAIDNTTSKTTEIRPAGNINKKQLGSIMKKEKGYYGRVKPKLREFKIKSRKKIKTPRRFIEKRRFAIDTRGEKRGLSLAKFAKQVTGTKKKVIKRKTSSGNKRKLSSKQISALAKGRKILAMKRKKR